MENRRVKSDTTIVIYDQIQLLCASLRFDVKYNPIAEKSFFLKTFVKERKLVRQRHP